MCPLPFLNNSHTTIFTDQKGGEYFPQQKTLHRKKPPHL